MEIESKCMRMLVSEYKVAVFQGTGVGFECWLRGVHERESLIVWVSYKYLA